MAVSEVSVRLSKLRLANTGRAKAGMAFRLSKMNSEYSVVFVCRSTVIHRDRRISSVLKRP